MCRARRAAACWACKAGSPCRPSGKRLPPPSSISMQRHFLWLRTRVSKPASLRVRPLAQERRSRWCRIGSMSKSRPRPTHPCRSMRLMRNAPSIWSRVKSKSRASASQARKNDIRFPNESTAYRRARDKLLAKEIELRRAMEAVAVQRRALPQGGMVPEDYVFEGLGPDGKAAKVTLSELFAPRKDSLIAYSFMFPRYPKDDRPGPAEGATAQLKREDAPCPSCTAFLVSLDGAAKHIEAAAFNFVVIAAAPLDQ